MRNFELRDDFHFDLGQSKVVKNGQKQLFWGVTLREKNLKVPQKIKIVKFRKHAFLRN